MNTEVCSNQQPGSRCCRELQQPSIFHLATILAEIRKKSPVRRNWQNLRIESSPAIQNDTAVSKLIKKGGFARKNRQKKPNFQKKFGFFVNAGHF
ncbi:hypothetical protein [Microbulbifer sp. Q7]|uniref:hypothetical protein n=1 Tax=Microbulbifer sp. Q7 TaxID=1785091 RepID=UPI000B166ED4|nr:hypothetical protein [Microbulbifer sp. Q7]